MATTSSGTPEQSAPAGQSSAASAEQAGDPKPVLDPALAKKHNLPQEYVDAVNRGEQPHPPRLGDNHDGSTELHFTPGGWQITPKGKKPGESTAISR